MSRVTLLWNLMSSECYPLSPTLLGITFDHKNLKLEAGIRTEGGTCCQYSR